MSNRLLYSLVFCWSMIGAAQLNAQSGINDTLRVEAFITPEGDTIAQSWLPPAQVNAIQTANWRKY